MPEEVKKENYGNVSIHINHYGEDNEYAWSIQVRGKVGKHDAKGAMDVAADKLIKAIEAATEGN